MTAGRDYTLIALSIDPSETVADAKEAKAEDLSRYPLPGGQQAAHFLTGSSDSVQAVADAVGFRDRFDPDLKQFLHPAGIVFTTASGVVSSYLLGVGYEPGDRETGRDAGQTWQYRRRGIAGPSALLPLRSDRPAATRSRS